MAIKAQKLSRREREIMDILLELREATAQEVRERLPDPPSNSAARALLARLEKKGAIRHIERDLRYVYVPSTHFLWSPEKLLVSFADNLRCTIER